MIVRKQAYVLYVLLFLFLLPPVLVWFFNALPFGGYVNAPRGQIFYLFSKLSGLLALWLIMIQLVLMLGKKIGFFDISIRAHMVLGIFIITAIVLHGGLFVAGVSIRQGALNLAPLLPAFDHGFYKTRLSLGNIAAILIVFTVISGALMRKCNLSPLKRSVLKWLHAMGFIAYFLGLIHALSIGSEIEADILFYMVLLVALVIGAFLMLRLRK